MMHNLFIGIYKKMYYKYMDTEFNFFVENDLSMTNLIGFNKLYLLIGTYPTILMDTKNYARVEQSLLFEIVFNFIIKKNTELLVNTIFYFIDPQYDGSYFDLVNRFLNETIEPSIFKNSIEHNRMCIHFIEINCKIYLLSCNIPTIYNFRYHSLPNIDFNIPKQMTYSLKCDNLSVSWGLFLHNISIYLTKDPRNKIYILNDALMFGHNIIPNIVDNKNFEFFCELGYILNQLYLRQLGSKIFVYIPNDRKTVNFKTIPNFESLDEVYVYNYGTPTINLDGTKLNSEEQLRMADMGLDGRTVYYDYDGYDDYDVNNYTLIDFIRKHYPKLSGDMLNQFKNN